MCQAALLVQLLKLLDVFLIDHIDAIGSTDRQEHAQIEHVILFQLVDGLIYQVLLKFVG